MSVINVTCPDLARLYVSLFLSKMPFTSKERTREIYPPRSASSRSPIKGVAGPLQVILAFLVGQRHARGLLHLLSILSQKGLINLGGGRCQGGSGDEFLSV